MLAKGTIQTDTGWILWRDNGDDDDDGGGGNIDDVNKNGDNAVALCEFVWKKKSKSKWLKFVRSLWLAAAYKMYTYNNILCMRPLLHGFCCDNPTVINH